MKYKFEEFLKEQVSNWKEKVKMRKEYNEKILKVLTKYLEENPEIRFGQALINLNILQIEKDKNVVFDPFSDESVDIYQRMSKK